MVGVVGVGLGAPEVEVAMGTHSPAPKVAFAIHVDLVEARAAIPARLLPQLDLVAFGGASLIEVLYFVADPVNTAVVRSQGTVAQNDARGATCSRGCA